MIVCEMTLGLTFISPIGNIAVWRYMDTLIV